MEEAFSMRPIAYIRTEFASKFGVPRQSGLADTTGEIIFLPEFRNYDALRGIEDWEYLWLVWIFHKAIRENWSPTVRPPRLGGNRRMGVFATRSPFRPNPIGLSSVRLIEVRNTQENGMTLLISGADLVDSTPILDIKPYLPYTDAHPGARAGFTDETEFCTLSVEIPTDVADILPVSLLEPLRSILSLDPRPHYHSSENRIYGFLYAGYEVRFHVIGHVLTVDDIHPIK